MKLEPIINSLLETDMYKFSMGQAIYHQFSDYKTTWTFKCRNQDVHFTPEMVEEIREQIKAYCDLRFTEEELEYLHNITWIKGSYTDFLRLWQPRYADIQITEELLSIAGNKQGLHRVIQNVIKNGLDHGEKKISIVLERKQEHAIVNEVYFRMAYDYKKLEASFEKRLDEKLEALNGTYCIGAFSEFGLRRRLSAQTQELAVRKFSEAKLEGSVFVGTSNVYLAKKYHIKPVGTMAHEWIMCVGQGNHKHNPAYSNWYALDAWVKEYGVLNGIALTDAITTDCFLRDFQLTYATGKQDTSFQ